MEKYKQAKDVQEEHSEEVAPNNTSSNKVVENVAIRQLADNLQLFHFLSYELMQVRNHRNKIMNEKKRIETWDHSLAVKE